MKSRSETYCDLSSRLAFLADDTLVAHLKAVKPTSGWGSNRVLEIENTAVFVKSVPLTELELKNPYSTANIFELPTYYNYGVGSAGFGAFRELASHVKTTNWVISGTSDNFPLMYHHRILPAMDPPKAPTGEKLDEYVNYWNGSAAIRRLAEARLVSTHQLVLFLEFVPHVMQRWLGTHLSAIDRVVEQMLKTTEFLRAQGIVHFDAHLQNILSDGSTVLLADFGLVLDEEFDLSPDEKAFLRRHSHYDIAEFLACLVDPLVGLAKDWSTDVQQQLKSSLGDLRGVTLLRHLEDLRESGQIEVPDVFAEVSLRYREVIEAMDSFFCAIRKPKKDAHFDDKRMSDLLLKAR
jgi:serine/threonine protein kinase